MILHRVTIWVSVGVVVTWLIVTLSLVAVIISLIPLSDKCIHLRGNVIESFQTAFNEVKDSLSKDNVGKPNIESNQRNIDYKTEHRRNNLVDEKETLASSSSEPELNYYRQVTHQMNIKETDFDDKSMGSTSPFLAAQNTDQKQNQSFELEPIVVCRTAKSPWWIDPVNACWDFKASVVNKCDENLELDLTIYNDDNEEVTGSASKLQATPRLGDMGQAVTFNNLTAEVKKLIEELKDYYGYNEYTSEAIGFQRRLPDYRHSW